MTHVYFAHAIADYDTDYEQQCIELIKEQFSECKIHNPKEISKLINKNLPEQGRFKAYFFPEILKCDTLIAAPVFNHKKKDKLMSGTVKEIKYALKHKKQVFIVSDNRIIKIETNELTCEGCIGEIECTPDDFAICQGDGYVSENKNEHLCPNHSVIPQC